MTIVKNIIKGLGYSLFFVFGFWFFVAYELLSFFSNLETKKEVSSGHEDYSYEEI